MFCPARTNVTDNVLEESGGERGGVKITVGTENIVGGLEKNRFVVGETEKYNIFDRWI